MSNIATFDGFSISTGTVNSVTEDQRRRAVYSGALDPVIKNLYSIALYDVLQDEVLLASGLDPAARSRYGEYFFTTPPRVHEFDEPFTTIITPTQNGGKFVESHGSILKSIRIQGTTGLRPNPVRNIPEIPLLGNAVGQISDALGGLLGQSQGISTSEATGFDDIIFLRNIFRLYSDIKEREDFASQVVMLWRNAKDSDYWIVEPNDFRLVQNSKSPMTYEYQIQFTTLSKFSTQIAYPKDPLASMRATSNFFSRVQRVHQSLKRLFLIISNQINRLEAAGVFVANSILGPMVSVIRGLNQVKATTTSFGSAILNSVNTLFSNLNTEIERLAQSPKFDTQDDIINSLVRTMVLTARLIREPAFRDTVGSRSNTARNRIVSAYASGGSTSNPRVVPATGGSASFLGNEPTPNGLLQDTVGYNEDIRAIAGRLLGDRGRWQTLVVLNDLSAPYIDPSGTLPGTLSPGDPILYPSTASRGIRANNLSYLPQTNAETKNQSPTRQGPAQQAYGRDLRLRSVPTGAAVDASDLSISQNGDISTVVGVSNVSQSLLIKFATERGELPAHPAFGAKYPIGKKVNEISAVDFSIQVEATIKSDPRIKSIDSLNFRFTGDVLSINAKLVLLDAADILAAVIPVWSRE